MSRLQKLFLALIVFGVITLALSRPGHAIIQSQRDQIGVTIVVNVTPSPVAYAPRVVARAQSAPRIMARFALRARGSARYVDADVMPRTGELIAQAQSAIKVQASVTPNPNATLVTTNYPAVTLSGVAGSTVHQACAYTVSVDTTITAWTLKHGLSADFGSNFPGNDAANNSYLQGATPQPTSTPFVVYPTSWTILAASGLARTYCVDLTITIPANIPGGTYSSNAVYTLYY